MELKSYIDIEEGLSFRLSKSWAKVAAPLYGKMLKKVSAGDFDAARKLVEEVDLTEVALKNKAGIRSFLRASLLFGASVASNGKDPVVSIGQYKALLDRATDVFCRSVEWNATVYTVKAALAAISEAEAVYTATVKKAEAQKRFVREFVSFQKDGDDMLKLISSLHTNRLAVWGFTAEAEVLGLETYQLRAVLDGRTSEFCRLINGKVFQVQDARKSIVEILNVDNPDDVKELQPWPKQTKDSIASYKSMSSKELTALNLHIPPFHPKCRTLLVRTSSAVVGTKLLFPVPQDLPSRVAGLPRVTEEGKPDEAGKFVLNAVKNSAAIRKILSQEKVKERVDSLLTSKTPSIVTDTVRAVSLDDLQSGVYVLSASSLEKMAAMELEKLLELINETPIVVGAYKKKLIVLDGLSRVMMAKLLGAKFIPAQLVPLD